MIHLQRTVPNWTEALHRLPDKSLVKSVDNGQVFAEVKAVNPNIYTCLRHHYDHGQVFGGTYAENKVRAREFFATFIDDTFKQEIAPHCDFVEEWNEYLADSQNAYEVAERVMWAEAAADVWMNEYRILPELAHIRLVLCNTAVGNSIPGGFFEIAKDRDCLLGYHPYTYWKNKVRGDHDWAGLSGLWDGMENLNGIDADWLFTEAGPFESAIDGWRSDACLGADRALYIEAMRQWIRDVQQTDAYQEGRIYGFAMFTTGRAGDVWKHFWTEQPELNDLSDMIAQEWNPGTYVPPVEPPVEPECRGQPREQYNRTYNVIPGDATDGEAVSIFLEGWQRSKETSGGSYDDAGIGDLDQRTARLYGIDPDLRQEYLNWYVENYPGVQVVFVNMPSAGTPDIDIINLVDDLPQHQSKVYDTRALTDITTLTIHHTVSPPDRPISSIAQYHVDKGWPGIGYHYVISDTGEIYQTNYLETKSYHAGSYSAPGDENKWSVGISLQGDFTHSPPPDEQLDAARWLVAELKEDLQIDEVLGHRQMPGASTACPGNTYDEWLDYVAGG